AAARLRRGPRPRALRPHDRGRRLHRGRRRRDAGGTMTESPQGVVPGRRLRIGIVCPYSFEAPGGVQFHVRDLAEALIAQGHEVGVLVAADDDTELAPYMTSAGGAIPLRYN